MSKKKQNSGKDALNMALDLSKKLANPKEREKFLKESDERHAAMMNMLLHEADAIERQGDKQFAKKMRRQVATIKRKDEQSKKKAKEIFQKNMDEIRTALGRLVDELRDKSA
jgi:hypothetical protein